MSAKPIYRSAVALQYEGGVDETPKLSVKEENYSADEVIKIAKRFGVEVVEDPSLIKALKAVELDQEIPEELFEAVAALLNEIEKKTKSPVQKKPEKP